ncbi:E3 ubiquitin-protein ligase HERC2-like isoform X2 [Macaca nemestrina]|uniref:E3 ubiquitin-protein ligase HERC2-like isoform X2 n=1 Tax=Macaca nemestrina TaxID=9545 RepID=UPI0039B93BCC
MSLHSFLILSFAWSSCSEWSIGLCVPFLVDICSVTFEQLDLLLRQLHAAISHQVDPELCRLGLGSVLLNSLKQMVVTLASSTGVLSTMQSSAEAMPQSGWSVLLPSTEERARALSAPLPCAVSGNDVNISQGCQFMSDLLVGSLVAAGELESALYAAITAEIQVIEAKKEAQKEKEVDEQEANASTFHRSRTALDKDLVNMGICESSGKRCLPLVQLVQQLLRCEKRGPKSSRNLPSIISPADGEDSNPEFLSSAWEFFHNLNNYPPPPLGPSVPRSLASQDSHPQTQRKLMLQKDAPYLSCGTQSTPGGDEMRKIQAVKFSFPRSVPQKIGRSHSSNH